MAHQRNIERDEPQRTSENDEQVRGVGDWDRDDEFDDTDDLEEDDADEDDRDAI
jgi:hypothetical protein